MKDNDQKKQSPPDVSKPAEPEQPAAEADVTTGSEGGGPGVGFGTTPREEQSPDFDRPMSTVARNQARGSKEPSAYYLENPMGIIPRSVHGVMDYVLGFILFTAPWLLGFNYGGAEMWIPIILGAGTICYSLLTDYELGVVGAIPMPIHLGLDVIAGLVLAVSPWLFGFAVVVWIPHLVIGLVEIGSAVMTRTAPQATYAS